MRNIYYSQQMHSKRIVSSQVFTIRFSLELKCSGLIALLKVALVSVDRCISPVLVCVISSYCLGTNITYTWALTSK